MTQEKMADPVFALVEVKVKPQVKTGFDETARHIFQDPCVIDHYLISGNYDFLLVIKAQSIAEVSHFISHRLSHLDNIMGTETHFVLKKYKEKGQILDAFGTQERLPVSA